LSSFKSYSENDVNGARHNAASALE
jgi:hypothetical protein